MSIKNKHTLFLLPFINKSFLIGIILRNEMSELVDSSNIVENNFWNEENFESVCRFEYRDYLDLSGCKFNYI